MTRTLVVPDLHHDLPWLGRVLDAERGQYDRLVLLGDYFDARDPECTAKKVARCLLELPAEVERQCGRPIPVTFLVGNHDYQYAMLRHTRHPPAYAHAVPGGCSGYSKTRATDIRHVLDGTDFWDKCRLATEAGGYLLSHAGVLPHLWPILGASWIDDCASYEEAVSDEASVFLGKTEQAWRDRFASHDHPAFHAGRARGGAYERSGLLWCDWNEEFEDALPLPQIVGHTASRSGARQKGRSWCIDGQQTTYAVIHGGRVGVPGEVEIKKKPNP